jgi:hypothetical protein
MDGCFLAVCVYYRPTWDFVDKQRALYILPFYASFLLPACSHVVSGGVRSGKKMQNYHSTQMPMSDARGCIGQWTSETANRMKTASPFWRLHGNKCSFSFSDSDVGEHCPCLRLWMQTGVSSHYNPDVCRVRCEAPEPMINPRTPTSPHEPWLSQGALAKNWHKNAVQHCYTSQ